MSNKYLDIAIEKVVKQEINKVLGQIMDEVKKMPRWKINQEEVLQIIDKYRESEIRDATDNLYRRRNI